MNVEVLRKTLDFSDGIEKFRFIISVRSRKRNDFKHAVYTILDTLRDMEDIMDNADLTDTQKIAKYETLLKTLRDRQAK